MTLVDLGAMGGCDARTQGALNALRVRRPRGRRSVPAQRGQAAPASFRSGL
jgi:hypothetical protein